MFQVLVELADLQDQEVGDGTTSVVILAAELLKRAHDLIRTRIHPTSVMSGFKLAMKEVKTTFLKLVFFFAFSNTSSAS